MNNIQTTQLVSQITEAIATIVCLSMVALMVTSFMKSAFGLNPGRSQSKGYLHGGIVYTHQPYELELDPGRGVLYLHSLMTGETKLRICRIPEEVWDDFFHGKSLSISLMYTRPRTSPPWSTETIKKSPVFIHIDPHRTGFTIDDEAGAIIVEVLSVSELQIHLLEENKFLDITLGLEKLGLYEPFKILEAKVEQELYPPGYSLHLLVNRVPLLEELRFTNRGNAWFAEKYGYVKFFTWKGPENEGGFAGDIFYINMEDGTNVILKGPWSSNSGYMNSLGFTPSIEATLTIDGEPWSKFAAAVTVETAKNALAKYAPDFEVKKKDHRYEIVPIGSYRSSNPGNPSEYIEIPFKDTPSWVQEEWNKLHPHTIPHVHVYRTEVAKISPPVSDYTVRDIVAHKGERTMSRYVPSYDTLILSTPEDRALYFGGAIQLKPDESIAIMDFQQQIKTISLYIHPAVFVPPALIEPELTPRQRRILASVRAFVPRYRKEVFRRNKVTDEELYELKRMGLLDARGALTIMGRNIIRDEEPYYG